MTNNRQRQRLPLKAQGSAKNLSDDTFFYFDVVDFTADGLLVRLEGNPPRVGHKIRMAFEVTGSDPAEGISLTGEIRHVESQRQGGLLCGVRILSGDTPKDMDTFDEIYLERFFEADV